MQEEDQEKKDKIDNMVNLIKTMNNTYIQFIKKMFEHKIMSLQSDYKESDAQLYQSQKKKYPQKFRAFKECLKRILRQYMSLNRPQRTSLEALQKIQSKMSESSRCFQENGQGIQFSRQYNQEISIDMYTVRNGVRKVNAIHRKLQEIGQSIYFQLKHRNKNKEKPLDVTLMEIKDLYFQLLRSFQNNTGRCAKCDEVLKYCEKENTFLPPTKLSLKEGVIRQCFHEGCNEQKEHA